MQLKYDPKPSESRACTLNHSAVLKKKIISIGFSKLIKIFNDLLMLLY